MTRAGRLRRWLWPSPPARLDVVGSPEGAVHLLRARLSAAQAGRARSSDDDPYTVAAEHAALTSALASWREAAFHGLLAAVPGARDAPDLPSAFDLARGVALAVAGGAERLASVRDALATRPIGTLAALDEAALRDHARCAEAFVGALLDAIDRGPAAAARRLGRRVTRPAVIVAAVVALVAVAPRVRLALRPDRALSAPWRASSALAEFAETGRGFHPIEGGPDMFFHTRTEAQPWVAFDLGAGASFEEVTVRNRLDCCQERAAPLVLECSDDGRAWRELARRDGKFYLWTARFPRRVARHLRLRVPRVSTFHLAAVEVR